MSSASSTFRALLSQTTDTVERPKALAAGHYIGTIKAHEFGSSKNKNTPYLRLHLQPEEETEDTEGQNEGTDISKRELRADYYITPTSLYRLTDLLDAVLGKEQGRTFDDRIPDLKSTRVMFGVTQREAPDGTTIYNDVTTIVAAG